jgi:hypothetical protein
MTTHRLIITGLYLGFCLVSVPAQSKHSASSRYPSYQGRVMCGYQGWFRAEGDGSGGGWSHYSERGPLTSANLHPDFWPDVSEYEKTYPTSLLNKNGTTVRVFSSWDQSTTDLHFLQELIASADIVMPWTVQRFTPLLHMDAARYEAHVKADMAWCAAKNVDYAPCVCPGFSWTNMHKNSRPPIPPLNQIPRQKGVFYWSQISGAINAKAQMLYVAMFDEMDEGTAIMKCANHLPVGVHLCDYEGMPTDHYLWLTGKAGQMLRGEIPFSRQIPARDDATPALPQRQ